tara:strand:- start:449 stop:832 length:384 start_codon:yes stop_codon:yes gene_type:complete
MRILYIFLIIISCNSKQPINPNGDSEMSILMRDMVLSLDDLRLKIEENKINQKIDLDFAEIHKSNVTDSSFIVDNFDILSNNFSALLDSLESDISIENYNNLIISCLSCHNLVCPGPISKIDKMFID